MTRSELHALVDRLPEASIDEAARALRDVADSGHIDAAKASVLDEGLEQARRREGRPLEEVLHELGL